MNSLPFFTKKNMEKKAKDRQPLDPDGSRDQSSQEAIGSREEWKVGELAEQASLMDVDEIQREILRGDETVGDPDERDYAGRVDSNETAQGREEAKNDVKGKANVNG